LAFHELSQSCRNHGSCTRAGLGVGATHGAEPRNDETKQSSPRGETSAYELQGDAEAPGGTKKEIRAQNKETSLTLLREHETVDRKKMTAVSAKNNQSYKRAIAWFIPGRRAEQQERGREQQKAARRGRAERARAELACGAAKVGMRGEGFCSETRPSFLRVLGAESDRDLALARAFGGRGSVVRALCMTCERVLNIHMRN
jgi:hypothetical protein